MTSAPSTSYNEGGDITGDDEKAGAIVLHGLASGCPKLLVGSLAHSSIWGLGLSKNTIVKCPTADKHPVGVMPPTYVGQILGTGITSVPSWFNFWMMPAMSVLSSIPGESKDELDLALRRVEELIEELINEGVPSQNIVVTGASQGGALTLYTALHTKYKLGGFVPIVAWLPLLRVEPITSLPTPVNKDTPILHMNGMMDPIVPVYPAGIKTKQEMTKVFTNYKFKAVFGMTHSSTINPLTLRGLKQWLQQNTKLKF